MRRRSLSRRRLAPILAICVPGFCYLISAVVPSYSEPFAYLAGFLGLSTVVVMAFAVYAPKRIGPGPLRIAGAHLLLLPGILIAARLILVLASQPAVFLLALGALYAFAWFLPRIAPQAADAFLREMWDPQTAPMKFISRTALALGGAAGVVGAMIGSELDDIFGDEGALAIVAILMATMAIVGAAYISTSLWRQSKGLPAVPSLPKEPSA